MHPFIADQLVAYRQAQALADAHHSRLVRAAAANRPHAAHAGLGPWWRSRLIVGALALIAASVAFAGSPAGSGPDRATSRRPTGEISLPGLRAVASERVSYEAGASRTWSPRPQIVAVKVLSGRLTVYDGDGGRRLYAAGEGYAGGWAPYRTVNETDERVDIAITSHVQP